MRRHWILAATFLAVLVASSARGQTAPSGDTPHVMDGVWLAEQAANKSSSSLSVTWQSVFTIKDGHFQVTHFCGSSQVLTGTLAFDSHVDDAVDLNVEAVDLSEVWEGVKYPKCTLPAIYTIDEGRLKICFQTGTARHRPTQFAAKDNDTTLLTLARVHDGFQHLPENVVVTVRDSKGEPVAGASVFGFMSWFTAPKKPKAEWKYQELGKSDRDGMVTIKYADLEGRALAVRHVERKLIAMNAISPAILEHGKATVVLQPAIHVVGAFQSAELASDGKPIGWTNAYLLVGGERIGMCASLSGHFDFTMPAGPYTLYAYGENLLARNIDITVPPGNADCALPPISLTGSRLALLKGNPAPELEGVLAWKGAPTKLAELKGKYVLLEFWGYWCGPCVSSMPVMMEVAEHFKDKGLAVIGIHVDDTGEVDTVAKLDEKLAVIRAKYWSGKDLPFPVALTVGKPLELGNGDWQRGGTAAQYGIQGYPNTVLIDRDGKVVGDLTFADKKDVFATIEKLLGDKK